MPRGSRALLPAEIRTRPRTEVRAGRCSHGLFGLSRVFDTRRGNGFPFPSLLRFRRPVSKRRDARRSRALPDTHLDGSSRFRHLS
jgi:hypothetical protein